MGKGRPKTLPHPNIDAPSPLAGAPTCPKDLDAAAKKKWKQVVKLMADAGTITRLDVDLLAMYCEAYSRRANALEQLKGKYVNGKGASAFQNPILHVANKAMDQMIRLSKLLGLDKMTAEKLGVRGSGTKQAASGPAVRGADLDLPPPTEDVG